MGAVLVVLTLLQLGLGRRSEREGERDEPRSRFLTRRRGGRGWHWTDVVTWAWLVGGLLLMFGPALWLVASSFKTPAQLAEFPPTLLPYVAADGDRRRHDKPLPLYRVTLRGRQRRARSPRSAASASSPRWSIPPHPDEIVKVNIADRTPVRDDRLRRRRTTPSPSCTSTSCAISGTRSS